MVYTYIRLPPFFAAPDVIFYSRARPLLDENIATFIEPAFFFLLSSIYIRIRVVVFGRDDKRFFWTYGKWFFFVGAICSWEFGVNEEVGLIIFVSFFFVWMGGGLTLKWMNFYVRIRFDCTA